MEWQEAECGVCGMDLCNHSQFHHGPLNHIECRFCWTSRNHDGFVYVSLCTPFAFSKDLSAEYICCEQEHREDLDTLGDADWQQYQKTVKLEVKEDRYTIYLIRIVDYNETTCTRMATRGSYRRAEMYCETQKKERAKDSACDVSDGHTMRYLLIVSPKHTGGTNIKTYSLMCDTA